MSSRLLVTGGLGFIGSEFVRRAVSAGWEVANADLRTYAADQRRLGSVEDAVRTEVVDISSAEFVELVGRFAPQVIVHFAAESHVTRSESDAALFFRTNVDGTGNVLSAASRAGVERVIHVSTDEVYGPCPGEPFREEDKLPGTGAATSAYARSKALADDVALSGEHAVPVIVARPTNCFGPWQHPEKAIGRWAVRALSAETLPVWGDGGQIRDWMHVTDLSAALELLIESGTPGLAYNVAPEGPVCRNLEVAHLVAEAAGRDDDAVRLTDYDRPDHDRRYAVDASRMRALGWEPEHDLRSALEETVHWYREHPEWWSVHVDAAEAIYHD